MALTCTHKYSIFEISVTISYHLAYLHFRELVSLTRSRPGSPGLQLGHLTSQFSR